MGIEQVQVGRYSTARSLPRESFEYWRSLYPRVHLAPADRYKGRRKFRGHLVTCSLANGTTFAAATNDDTIARFATPNSAFVMFAVGVAGGADIEQPGGESFALGRRGIAVIDGTRELVTRSYNHSLITLSLPRARVQELMGASYASLSGGALKLEEKGLSTLFVEQARSLAQFAERLDGTSAGLAVSAISDLAVAAVIQAVADDQRFDRSRSLYDAALTYIDTHASSPELAAATVAQALECSRSSLYRAFAERGRTIGAAISETRLENAKLMLRALDSATIDQVAAACGYSSGSVLARLFRRRLGMSPTAFQCGDHR